MANTQDSQVSSITASGSGTHLRRATFSELRSTDVLALSEVSIAFSESFKDPSNTPTTADIAATGYSGRGTLMTIDGLLSRRRNAR